jgi:modification methylase
MVETMHRVIIGDSADMSCLEDGCVHLVVTSPPYPLVKMWDSQFSRMDPRIGTALNDDDGETAFELMHDLLARVWDEVERVLCPGGIACVNVGDATRTIGGSFQLFPNHMRVLEHFRATGMTSLPGILWRKTTNAPTKFMGSGTTPSGAYVTLEHEHILILRKGAKRTFGQGEVKRRAESGFFWEERNEWFSDIWEVAGRRQTLSGTSRARSAAFPIEIPYRLISMFSIKGDLVLDPFAGIGTTAAAAAMACRNSISFELEPGLRAETEGAIKEAPALGKEIIASRLERHRAFIGARGRSLRYINGRYDFPVVTHQETGIVLDAPSKVTHCKDGTLRVSYLDPRRYMLGKIQ